MRRRRSSAFPLAHDDVGVFGPDLHLAAAERTKARLLSERVDAHCGVPSCEVTNGSQLQAVAALQWRGDDVSRRELTEVGTTVPTLDLRTVNEKLFVGQADRGEPLNWCLCAVERSHLVMIAREGGAVLNDAGNTTLKYIAKPQVAYASAETVTSQFMRTKAVFVLILLCLCWSFRLWWTIRWITRVRLVWGWVGRS